MSNDAKPDIHALTTEMRGLVQEVIMEWFVDLLRIRVATQSPTQRALTMAMLEEDLAKQLPRHASQRLPSPMSETDTMKASLFKDAFKEQSLQIMTTIGKGLTVEELAAID